MLYRALRNLAEGDRTVPFGSIIERTYSANVLRALIDAGAVAEIQPPPLAILPHWTVRARKLAKGGIITVADLLGATDEAVAKIAGCAPSLVERWKQEVRLGLLASHSEG